MIRLAFIACLVAGPVFAQATGTDTGDAPEAPAELRPAPGYYVSAIIDITIAQQLARACRELSLDPPKVEKLTDTVLTRLAEDGFDSQRPYEQMVDPSDEFSQMQAAFLDKHALEEGIGETEVCAAGTAEIAEGSGIGGLLIEVSR